MDDDNRDLMPDELSSRWAAARLGEKHNSPFFLAVGFNRPHTPLYAPQKYFVRFPLSEIELPPYKADDLDDAPEIVRELFAYGLDRGRSFVPLLRDPAKGEWDGPDTALSAQMTRPNAKRKYGEIGEAQYSVRGNRWRYTRYGDGSEEFYDHAIDPNEWKNRAGDGDVMEDQSEMRSRFDRLSP